MLILLIVFGGVLAAQEATPPQKPSPRTLENLLSELLRLELEESKERSAWDEQSGRLDAMTALLQAEKARLAKAIMDFKAKEKTEQTEQERLARGISTMKDTLTKIASSATKAGQKLLAEYKKLPEPLREKLKVGTQLVRAGVDKKALPKNTVDRLRTVVAFGLDMQRVLSEIHAVKQVIDMDDKQRLEVDVIYLGGAVGFYLTPDRKRAGVLKRSKNGWRKESKDEIAAQVELALKVKRKETPPTLVRLPLQPPGGKKAEKK